MLLSAYVAPLTCPDASVPQESLRESCSQVSLLQQRERERELELERERERERDKDRSTQALRELEAKVQDLVEQGLVRMQRSSSGRLDVQVVPVIQHVMQTGQTSSSLSGCCLRQSASSLHPREAAVTLESMKI